MPAEGPRLTIVLNLRDAELYARLIADRFPQVRTIVAPRPEQLANCIKEADALLASSFPVDLLEQAKKMRWFQCTNAGVDSILPIRERVRHITVTNARGLHGEIIADFVMAGVTMLHWDFRKLLRDQAERKWSPRFVAPLAEKTLGVVGLGSIGGTIARRAKSAGMTVVGSKRDVSVPVDGVDRLFASDALEKLLPLCDFVVLAVPATATTMGLIGATEIARMRRDAFLINIARGQIVVEAELIKALEAGTIAGALLDVFEREPLPKESLLWDMPNVIATPHISGSPTNYTERLFSIFADNIERFLSGRALTNVVDLGRGY
ncbi:phosphoglycerate dehydrogenase-like enzyme [Bradyrhizobium sp. USDA 4524]|nr:D-2-hydroxyacid dehydrogenase [Bradyrhizobium sp. USDA 4538]MCP1838622.1 phosphoglycerate dehydrogenase-like enzyme [Bradyrhizobium sp. USDA 4538]MCP1899187.1 phosphoglycerate dehydrogenase-like enzyme [Bradyrhizobium sp. USDA 4537]MCP1986701.1 phosphoglycerate dehydrogenase-like enzyme [Bradyrhizobium sp. USDA 4539]